MQLDVNLQLICNFDQNLFHAVQISLKELKVTRLKKRLIQVLSQEDNVRERNDLQC